MSYVRELTMILIAVAFVYGCGNKGDLYLPDAEPTMQQFQSSGDSVEKSAGTRN